MAPQTHTPILTADKYGALYLDGRRILNPDIETHPGDRAARAAGIAAAMNERAALLAERDRLRAALEKIAFGPLGAHLEERFIRIARAALAATEEKP